MGHGGERVERGRAHSHFWLAKLSEAMGGLSTAASHPPWHVRILDGMRFGAVRTRGIILPGIVLLTVYALAAGAGGSTTPVAKLASEQRVQPQFQQGIARMPGGWVVSGNFTIARADAKLKVTKQASNVIPLDLRKQGYNHVGDIDVVGKYIYAPLEESDYTRGTQVTARYDVTTLRFVDSVQLAQHENSFVTVDPATMIAYSMDHFDGASLLRYDVRKNWAPLPPLVMSTTVTKVQGGDVAAGAVWLSTSDPTNGLYRVDLKTGHVDSLGSAGHVPGEGEGIDATKLRSGRLHTLVVDPTRTPVWLGHFAVVE